MATKHDPKAVGERTEGLVLAALLRAGKVVLQPFGDNQRYDLVVDDGGGQFLRVQCKTGRLETGAVRFSTCSTNRTGRRGYVGEIDAFGVYCPHLDKVYLVPVSLVGDLVEGCLRVEPSKNGQKNGVRQAIDFELKKIS